MAAKFNCLDCERPLAAMKEKLGQEPCTAPLEVTVIRKDDDTFTRTCVMLVVSAAEGGGGGEEAG